MSHPFCAERRRIVGCAGYRGSDPSPENDPKRLILMIAGKGHRLPGRAGPDQLLIRLRRCCVRSFSSSTRRAKCSVERWCSCASSSS